MARTVSADASVAWLNADHPGATDGAGFYEITQDNEMNQQLDDEGNSLSVTHTNVDVKVGKRLNWVKDNPESQGQPNNPENNAGHFVYADSEEGADE